MSSIQELMRELDEKEEAIKSVQDQAERLMQKNHPARLTIEVSPFLCLQQSICIRPIKVMLLSLFLLDVTRMNAVCVSCRHTELPCRPSGAGFYSSAPVWSSISRRTLFILR